MARPLRNPFWLVVSVALLAVLAWSFFSAEATAAAAPAETSGSLQILGKDGAVSGNCPLKHTEVRGAVSGFIARVEVTQTFENSSAENIEAVYAFPLPENAAVDDMTIQVGNRTGRGVIKQRDEARTIYENAKQTGHVTAQAHPGEKTLVGRLPVEKLADLTKISAVRFVSPVRR